MEGNYEQILGMISRTSGLSVNDIERKIEARRAKLSGLISKEGAAQIVASELGINFEKQRMKVSELISGMKKINVVAKIIKLNRIIEYNKNGRQGKIASFLLADETSNIRTVLWDMNHIELIEKGEISENDVVEISNASVRNSEIHLTNFSEIKKSQEIVENVKTEPVVQKKTISQIELNNNLSVRAFVVQIFGPNFFYVCPECGKKVSDLQECAEHGKVISKRRGILNFVIDDGTETIRATLFHDQIMKIVSEDDLINEETFMGKRKEFLGKEFVIIANARKNNFSGNVELIVDDIQDINLDKLIEELEK